MTNYTISMTGYKDKKLKKTLNTSFDISQFEKERKPELWLVFLLFQIKIQSLANLEFLRFSYKNVKNNNCEKNAKNE